MRREAITHLCQGIHHADKFVDVQIRRIVQVEVIEELPEASCVDALAHVAHEAHNLLRVHTLRQHNNPHSSERNQEHHRSRQEWSRTRREKKGGLESVRRFRLRQWRRMRGCMSPDPARGCASAARYASPPRTCTGQCQCRLSGLDPFSRALTKQQGDQAVCKSMSKSRQKDEDKRQSQTLSRVGKGLGV